VLGASVYSAASSCEVASVFVAEWEQVHIVLLDIEGTTTPIDFVYKTLFPYASRQVESFLREHVAEPEIVSLVEALRAQNQVDNAAGLQLPVWSSDSDEARLRSVVAYTHWLIGRDSKCTPWKSLQGRIWQRGFASGELHGEVYADVPPAFARWRGQRRDICIYSSGSVLAQQQLFRTVISGDLTPHIVGFFDTQTGLKNSAESYGKIAASLGRAPREFLFISDAQREVQAARAAGMYSVLCDRSTSATAQQDADEAIHSFDDVFPH
jgi:enolase-phosphatase E1